MTSPPVAADGKGLSRAELGAGGERSLVRRWVTALRDRRDELILGAGPTLIVSPLVALMRNQVDAAARAGITAHTINSSNTEKWEQVEQRALGPGLTRDDCASWVRRTFQPSRKAVVMAIAPRGSWSRSPRLAR